jgi:hypothetical protein
MEFDRVIPYDELIRGDPRHDMYEGRITTDWIQQALREMRPSPRIPPPVLHQLSLAKQLCIAGWFLWDLYAVALHYTAVACEVAVRCRFVESLSLPIRLVSRSKKNQEELLLSTRPDPDQLVEHLRSRWRLPGFDDDFRGGFRQLVTWGRSSGAIPEQDLVRWDAAIDLRNSHAHGSETILPVNIPLAILRFSTWMINALYLDPATEAHDAPLRASDREAAMALDRVLRESSGGNDR